MDTSVCRCTLRFIGICRGAVKFEEIKKEIQKEFVDFKAERVCNNITTLVRSSKEVLWPANLNPPPEVDAAAAREHAAAHFQSVKRRSPKTRIFLSDPSKFHLLLATFRFEATSAALGLSFPGFELTNLFLRRNLV